MDCNPVDIILQNSWKITNSPIIFLTFTSLNHLSWMCSWRMVSNYILRLYQSLLYFFCNCIVRFLEFVLNSHLFIPYKVSRKSSSLFRKLWLNLFMRSYNVLFDGFLAFWGVKFHLISSRLIVLHSIVLTCTWFWKNDSCHCLNNVSSKLHQVKFSKLDKMS